MSAEMQCSFCGNADEDITLLPSLKDAWICFSCVMQAWELIQGGQAESAVTLPQEKLTPTEIKKELDKIVVGQEDAKKVLAVAGYNHLKRISNSSTSRQFKKSNVLLIGSTGSGKTYLVENLGRILGVPFVAVDGSTFTSSGYVGASAEDALRDLLEAAGGSMHAAQQGIIYIDEVDKMANSADSRKSGKENLGKGAQHSFLRLVDGGKTVVGRQQRSSSATSDFVFDTSNVLFICGGSFAGLEEIVERHTQPKEIGFQGNVRSVPKDESFASKIAGVKPEHLCEYGLIPEFIGRIPVTAILQDLTVKDLTRIIVEPENSLLSQYQNLFGLGHIKLDIEPEALEEIAQLAIQRNVGARGLRGIMEEVLRDAMFDAPSDPTVRRVVITREAVLKTQPPMIFRTHDEEPLKAV